MYGQRLVDDVEESAATELDRLGSDKYLVAATGADLGAEPVLRTVARSTGAAGDVFERWADAVDADDVASAFARAARTEREHFERIVAALPAGADVDSPSDDPGAGDDTGATFGDALPAALDESEGTVERVAAGFVGRPLVADRTLLQVVSFFVNEADDERADLARDLRADVRGRLDEGAAILDAVCESDDDWERARRAAERVVDAAYEEYASALEAMGVDPKPVC